MATSNAFRKAIRASRDKLPGARRLAALRWALPVLTVAIGISIGGAASNAWASVSVPVDAAARTNANQGRPIAPPANPAAKAGHAPQVRALPGKSPAVEKTPAHQSAPAEKGPAKRFAYPIAHSTHGALASAAETGAGVAALHVKSA